MFFFQFSNLNFSKIKCLFCREDAKKRFGAKAENAPAPAETLKSDNVGKAIPSDRFVDYKLREIF